MIFIELTFYTTGLCIPNRAASRRPLPDSCDVDNHSSRRASSAAPRLAPAINLRVAGLAGLVLLAGVLLLSAVIDARQAALYALGAALGVVLYHAAFGFTSAWRVFIADGRGAGLRAQMVMLAVAVLLFFPALSAGTLFGQPVSGNVSPLGVSVVVGAFIFGIGMQLGGGCASGTLYTVGGGSTRMVLTLVFFIAGSAIGAAHLHWWTAQPSLPRRVAGHQPRRCGRRCCSASPSSPRSPA